MHDSCCTSQQSNMDTWIHTSIVWRIFHVKLSIHLALKKSFEDKGQQKREHFKKPLGIISNAVRTMRFEVNNCFSWFRDDALHTCDHSMHWSKERRSRDLFCHQMHLASVIRSLHINCTFKTFCHCVTMAWSIVVVAIVVQSIFGLCYRFFFVVNKN